MVNKYVFSTFLLNEPKAFSIIKPLDSSVCHDCILLSLKFHRLKLEDAIPKNGLYLQKETSFAMHET
mgnify:CR=1 FL=1